jgi:hypothetical protein
VVGDAASDLEKFSQVGQNDPPIIHRSITAYLQALPCNRLVHRIILYSPRRTTQDVVSTKDSPDRQIALEQRNKSRESWSEVGNRRGEVPIATNTSYCVRAIGEK